MPSILPLKSLRKKRPAPLSQSIITAVAVILTGDAVALTDTWLGNVSENWNDLNWTGGNNPPVAGDSFLFNTAGTSGALLNNDLTPLFNVAGITFNAGASAFIFNGNSISLT